MCLDGSEPLPVKEITLQTKRKKERKKKQGFTFQFTLSFFKKRQEGLHFFQKEAERVKRGTTFFFGVFSSFFWSQDLLSFFERW